MLGKSPVTVVAAARTDERHLQPVIQVQVSYLGLATSQQVFLTRDNQPVVSLGSFQASLPRAQTAEAQDFATNRIMDLQFSMLTSQSERRELGSYFFLLASKRCGIEIGMSVTRV